MESIKQQIVRQKLTIIKQLVTKDKNGDKFILVNRDKNRNFMLEYGLLTNDIKDIKWMIIIKDLKKMTQVLKVKYGFLLLPFKTSNCI